MNYAAHNKELHHSLELSEPTIFMKSDSSLLKDGKPFFIPDFSSEIHYETEIVVKIDRLGKNIAERFAHRYYNEVTVGIDFTARDLQNKLRAQGLPWEISKAFDNSAVLGTFVPLERVGDVTASLSIWILTERPSRREIHRICFSRSTRSLPM